MGYGLHRTGVTSSGVPLLELIQPADVRRQGHWSVYGAPRPSVTCNAMSSSSGAFSIGFQPWSRGGNLDPVSRRARPVRRAQPLRHDALEAHAARLLEHECAFIIGVVAQHYPEPAPAQQPRQALLAVDWSSSLAPKSGSSIDTSRRKFDGERLALSST
jgi:hypothetical protein